ncbi:uncharacterized protein LOC134178183 isoform X2 [Corticium candelabrum]|nr:uncharacterized protein LOC134178183 isoform X2 [Corticium candelabrum]
MNTQGQPAERRHGSSERDYVDMKEAALQLVNNRDHKNLRLVKVVHGYKRTDSLRGTEYILDLFLALPSGAPVSQRLHLVRPYREMMIESVQTYTDLNLHISLIMPLSNRLEIFKQFMYRFRKCCIGQKFVDVFLVIVYFGKENLIELKELLGKYNTVFNWKMYAVLELDENFSRGRGLMKGAEYVQQSLSNHRVMFFCDVDVRFTTSFLQRCYRNVEERKRVYYPIVFSLYNPALAINHKTGPSVYIKRESGFWRDFGYGMACMYVSDFFNAGGFDLSIQGWGGEDVDLYEKLVKSGIEMMRSVDEGIYHIFHEKECNPSLRPEQYQSCMNSKISTSGSQKQLGNIIIEQQERINQLERELVMQKQLLKSKGLGNVTSNVMGGMAAPIADEAVAEGKQTVRRRGLKIYVYSLPGRFNHEQLKINDEDPPAIWDFDCTSNSYSTEYDIHQRLIDSEFRTDDPQEADLFYVPVYMACFYINQAEGEALEKTSKFSQQAFAYIRTNFPYFNRSKGRDHLWTFTLAQGPTVFGDWKPIKNGIFLVQQGRLSSDSYSPYKDVVIPSYVDPEDVRPIYAIPFTDRPTRTLLAHYSGSAFSIDNKQSTGDISSLAMQLVRLYSRVPRFRMSIYRNKVYFLDMMSSVFCLCPENMQDVHRVYESIILGCIPVIIGEDLELAFEDIVDYSKFVIRISLQNIEHLHTVLLGIKEDDIRRMRRDMEHVWSMISYDNKVGHAFDNIIYTLAKRKPEKKMKISYYGEQT